ncbi:MAG: ABC transporter substrate-binding protein [Geopsychrobacter sp.]|nr:ABC transporter substrate-binding protein [Geopsychrobacter sp.]
MRRLLVLFLVLCAFSAQAASLTPQARVQEMVDGIFSVLNSDLAPEVKKRQISGTVQNYLGVKSLSQRTLGVYWKKASTEELHRFMALYVQILEQTYLNRVDDYSGGKVAYLKERIKGKKAILDTEFVSARHKIPVQYKMIKKSDTWQIYDVKIEGVSLVRSYRSSYNEILRKEGFEGLFKRMDVKLKQMKKGA